MIWLSQCSLLKSDGGCLQYCCWIIFPKICCGLLFAHRMESGWLVVMRTLPHCIPSCSPQLNSCSSPLVHAAATRTALPWSSSPNDFLFPCQSPPQTSPSEPSLKMPFFLMVLLLPSLCPNACEEWVVFPLAFCSPLIYATLIFSLNLSPPLDSGLKDLGTISDSSLCL